MYSVFSSWHWYKKMNVLLVGSGAREHALAKSFIKSPLLTKLYSTPGSDAIGLISERLNLNLDDHMRFTYVCKEKNIDLVVFGPEGPLAGGLSDHLMEEGIHVFGPRKAAVRLESSKSFTKELCSKNGIPTAKFDSFVDVNAAMRFVNRVGVPVVIKADGFAGGKGVFICETKEEAQHALDRLLVEKELGQAGEVVVVEEFLHGTEVSLMVLLDGSNAIVLGSAQDHKRAYEGDMGPNTGGMGACSPVPAFSRRIEYEVVQTIIYPTIQAMHNMNIPFHGVLFAGLMICKNGPKLLEYNVRFGDPEIQTIIPRLETDILKLISITARGRLGNEEVKYNSKSVVNVVIANKGYPGPYKNGSIIRNLDKIEKLHGITVLHAGTKLDESGNWVSNGGRVLNIVAEGNSLEDAKQKAYSALDLLDWNDAFFRYDIGWQSISSKKA